MRSGTRFLRISATVFGILAWVIAGAQLVVGVTVLVMGGPPALIMNVDVPARVVGLLTIVSAGLYWFFLTFLNRLTRAVLDMPAQAPPRA